MSATVVDLLVARQRRGQAALAFDTDLDALAFITAELDEIRAEAAGELLVCADALEGRLARVQAVVSAVGDLYRRDERGTR